MAKKPRKWSNLKGIIPDDPSQTELSPRTEEILRRADARREAEIRDEAGQVVGTRPLTMEDLAEEWNALEQEEEFEDLARSDRNITYDALQKRILEELERVKAIAGTDMWRGPNQTFSPKYMLNVHIVDQAALMKWVRDNKLEHLLTIPTGRLKGLVGEAMNTDLAAAMTPAERAAMKPGEPGSGQPPPGVEVSLFTTVHHTAPGRRTRHSSDADDGGPF